MDILDPQATTAHPLACLKQFHPHVRFSSAVSTLTSKCLLTQALMRDTTVKTLVRSQTHLPTGF